MSFTDRYTNFLIRHRKVVLIVFAALVALTGLMTTLVTVNYDLAEYLPDDSGTKRAINVMESEFGYPGTARVMVDGVTIAEAKELKDKIAAVDGVSSVLWLDDVQDITMPLSAMPEATVGEYYKDGSALFTLQFSGNDYALSTGSAIVEIRSIVGDDAVISGTAENSRHMRDVLGSEVFVISIVIVPLCLLILLLASRTYIEPLIYIVTMLISVVINMGTNVFFTGVSFITFAMASVLQLAISMDYSLFMFHRYLEERESGADVPQAIAAAMKKSLASVSGSALTTIAGFLALLFMSYGLGADMGLVLAKGIVLSFVNVFIILPVFIYCFRNVIDKSKHRSWLPSFAKLGRGIIKVRWAALALLAVIAVPAFLASQSNDFLYGDASGSSSEGEIYEANQRVLEKFGPYNPVMLLVPNGDVASENAMADELQSCKLIRSVQSLGTLAGEATPRELIPRAVYNNFVGDNYTRLIVMLDVNGENPNAYEAVAELRAVADKYYPGEYLTAGSASSLVDIKDSVESDSLVVSLVSIIAVLLIVAATSRAAVLPVILVAVIEISIWINMSFPYFAGDQLIYIGYLIVSSLQLGATIDYAILMANRYLENRHTMSPRDAAVSAIDTAGRSVLVSALILITAGFAEGILSNISSISAMGVLLGRGALMSLLLVLFCLPALLVLFDKVIIKTTFGMKDVKLGHKKSGKELSE